MALTDYKITDNDVSTKGVQSAPDRLTGTAAQNKALFDKLIAEVVKEKLNDLIDELVTALSGKMPQPASMGSAGQYMKSDGQGGVSWDTPSGSGDMLRSVYDEDNDGRVDAADSALTCSGNAATATKLAAAISLAVADATAAHTGVTVSFDGSGNATLSLPATIAADIVGNLSGNASGNAGTATKLYTSRTMLVKNGDDNKAASVDFDGSANVELPLPTTLNITLGAIKLTDGVSYGTSAQMNAIQSPADGRVFFVKKV